MTQYRIVAATKSWQKSNFIIQKRSWYWPFWVQATDYSYVDIDFCKKVIEILKTNIRV